MLRINKKFFAKISKDILMQLICGVNKIIYTYPVKEYVKVNESKCSNCPKRHTSNCDNCPDKYIPIYGNEITSDSLSITHVYDVCKQEQLSKKAILLYLAYYFCNIKKEGNDGVIAVVQERELSNLIHCCMATIYNLNDKLQELGLIEYERIGKGLIRVVIKNYAAAFQKNRKLTRFDEDFNDLEFYGGYINLSFKWFKKLIEVATTTNLLRLALFKTLTYDSHKAKNLNKKNYLVEYYIRDYKKILTGELCNKEINDLTFLLSELFNDNIKFDVINEFELKDDYVANKEKAEFRSKCNKLYSNIFKTLTKQNHEDLEILSEQFGEETVQDMINYLIEKKSETHASILENVGLIRAAINQHIEYAFIRLTRYKIFDNDMNMTFTA